MFHALHRFLRLGLWVVAILSVVLVLYALTRSRPQDVPWTSLDLGEPIGLFTGRKLAGLTQDADGCRALLDRAGVAYRALPPVSSGRCGHADAVRLGAATGQIALRPADVAPSCPVAAALKMWEWNVVQPAAQRRYGQAVRTIEHFGSFSCRRLYGRSTGSFSEHATADAIDIAAFVLADGKRISVVGDWQGEDAEALFLRDVRDGACRLFATTLSPDYNAAHADHLHLDQAERGAMGGRLCR